MSQLRAGVMVLLRAKIVRLASEGGLMIEVPDASPARVHESMIVSVDVQEVGEGSPVESMKPGMEGIRGICLAINEGEAWVKWTNNGKPRTEDLKTLRVAIIRPT